MVYAGPPVVVAGMLQLDMRHLAHAAPQRRNAAVQRVCERTYLVNAAVIHARQVGRGLATMLSRQPVPVRRYAQQVNVGSQRSRLLGRPLPVQAEQRFTMFSSID